MSKAKNSMYYLVKELFIIKYYYYQIFFLLYHSYKIAKKTNIILLSLYSNNIYTLKI